MMQMGFIKCSDYRTNDQPTTDHLPNKLQTHRRNNHQPTARFYFKDLLFEKYLFYRIQTCSENVNRLVYLIWMNNNLFFITNINHIRGGIKLCLFSEFYTLMVYFSPDILKLLSTYGRFFRLDNVFFSPQQHSEL